MPDRPPKFNPFKTAAQPQQGRSTHARLNDRKSTTERGYGWAWQQARLVHLAEHPICVRCEQSGIITPANTVDHIVPHRGDMSLFWDSANNWQSLCKPCHDRKSLLEDSRFAYRGMERGMITVVCGPPGSGKTTCVKKSMVPGDLVVDLDAIWEAISGQPFYVKPDGLLPYVLNIRELLLHRLASDPTHPRAWVITMGARRDERVDLCRRLRANCVILPVPIDECIQRIANDPRRRTQTHRWMPLVRQWWANYEPDDLASPSQGGGSDPGRGGA